MTNPFRTNWLRWLAWFLVAVLFAVACVFLANWQFDRRQQAVAKIERMVKNYDQSPLDFSSLDGLSQSEITTLEWHPVKLKGKYIEDKVLLVRNRPIAGAPGFIQIVPFALESGEIIVLERGWIPSNSNLQPESYFLPSTVPKSLTARVKLSELTPNRDSPKGFITSIKLDELPDIIGLNIEKRFYLRLISEQPRETSYPQPLSKPLLDEGNHLSYAIQWILFAVMGFFALFWAIRQERAFRSTNGQSGPIPGNKKRRRPDDGTIEDQILDEPEHINSRR